MRTLHEIELKSHAINARMMDIFKELREEPERASELAEELAKLLFEAKALQCSLRYFQETAARLMREHCHGPH